MAAEKDVLLPHDADGIREYDNPLPAWWLGIFYFTIALAVVFPPYLYMTGWTQAGQYDEEVAVAEASKPTPAPAAEGATPAEIVADSTAGKAIWDLRCVACHKADGTGGIGPNLTDAEWIHGGTEDAIRKTVAEGVIEKGMVAWEPMLGAQGVADVSAYVHALGGGQ